MAPPRLGLSSKILIPALAISVVAALSIFWTFEEKLREQSLDDLRDRLDNFASIQAAALAGPVWAFDQPTIDRIFRSYAKNDDVLSVSLRDAKGDILAEVKRPMPTDSQRRFDVEEQLTRDSSGNSYHIGRLQVSYHDGRIQRGAIAQRVTDMAALAALLVLLAATLAVAIHFQIGKPLRNLRESLTRNALRSLREPLMWSSRDELGEVVDSYNALLSEVELRVHRQQEVNAALEIENQRRRHAEAELSQLAEALEARVAQRTAELVEAEKMASLAQMVGGIAHEINTPVGIAFTAASHFEKKTREFDRLYAAGGMRKSDLQAYVETAREASAFISTNLNRAADLIQSFKKVAVDQASDERRVFDLAEYLREIVLSLRPALKKAGHQVTVDCPPNLLMDSYPGALSQVLTNFVMNSLTHAYDEGQAGHLSIHAEFADGKIALVYGDDGCGIPAANIPHIFEPFFTTRRNVGGSGLGLHIAYNIVTTTLMGRIHCDAGPGQGARFIVTLPQAVDHAKTPNHADGPTA
jgi:signal transduction histidine kinase